jgi:hypothetical protein
LPSTETEAQSAAMPLSELGCDKLNVLNFQKMNQTQADYAGNAQRERLLGHGKGNMAV